MSAPEKYRSSSQQHLIQVVEALAERPLSTVGVDELAERLGCSRDQAYRTLRNLELADWAWQQEGTSAWRIAPRLTQLSERVRLAIADLHRAYLGDLA